MHRDPGRTPRGSQPKRFGFEDGDGTGKMGLTCGIGPATKDMTPAGRMLIRARRARERMAGPCGEALAGASGSEMTSLLAEVIRTSHGDQVDAQEIGEREAR